MGGLRTSLCLHCLAHDRQVDEQMLNVQNKNSSYFVEPCLSLLYSSVIHICLHFGFGSSQTSSGKWFCNSVRLTFEMWQLPVPIGSAAAPFVILPRNTSMARQHGRISTAAYCGCVFAPTPESLSAEEWIPNNIKASVCDIPPKGRWAAMCVFVFLQWFPCLYTTVALPSRTLVAEPFEGQRLLLLEHWIAFLLQILDRMVCVREREWRSYC